MMNERNAMQEILSSFALDAPVETCGKYGRGHINDTNVIVTLSGNRYILQRISESVFHDIPHLMENISNVTAYLKSHSSSGMKVLQLVAARDGKNYIRREDGFWRMYEFVENSICLQEPETVEDFRESAVGFGSFMNDLADFPVEKLYETIPDFHNTPDRYRLLRKAIEHDPLHRVAEVRKEIDFFLEREQEMGLLESLKAVGELPVRVTHNDTKLNNLLLDKTTRRSLCVLDLDTVMPGLSLYDYGDAIRFGTATAAEDERDLDRVFMDLDRFRAFTDGWISSCTSLTEKEIDLLPMGAKTMTLECGLRFLTDYIDGDWYFGSQRRGQNLDRSRTHIRLVEDMEAKWQQMRDIVDQLRGK